MQQSGPHECEREHERAHAIFNRRKTSAEGPRQTQQRLHSRQSSSTGCDCDLQHGCKTSHLNQKCKLNTGGTVYLHGHSLPPARNPLVKLFWFKLLINSEGMSWELIPDQTPPRLKLLLSPVVISPAV